ncbi:hypothetical protein ACWNX6_00015 [Candidatus Vidania fulgoroideorum]
MIIKLILKPGRAEPNSRLGSALGPHGINVGKFCSDFNRVTSKNDSSTEIIVKVFPNKLGQYKMILKKSPVSILIKKYLNINKGEKKFSERKIFLTEDIIKKVIEEKKDDFNTRKYISNRKTVISCAKSMEIFLKSNDK